MSFSDADLLRFKSFRHDGPKSDNTWVVYLPDLRALVSRLEAAENYIEALTAGTGIKTAPLFEKSWRKAAGKNENK